MLDYSLNEEAVRFVKDKIIPYQYELGVKVFKSYGGVNVIDMGIEVTGGWLAGKYFTEASLCGFGQVNLVSRKVNDRYMPHIEVYVDYPLIAEMSSHVAYYRFEYEGKEYNFSGPFRSYLQDDYSKTVTYIDESPSEVLLCLQIDEFPPSGLLDVIVKKLNIVRNKIYLIVAPTSSIVGSLQVTARSVEQVLPTLVDHGFDINTIKHACGIAPVNSIVSDENEAYGRVNDCLIYGQETNLHVDCEDSDISKLIDKVTMDQVLNKEIYGVPFKDIFALCDNDWCKVPRNWDAPSKINFYNIRTGNNFSIGKHCDKVLVDGFMGKGGKEID